jgi:hypothetical protein
VVEVISALNPIHELLTPQVRGRVLELLLRSDARGVSMAGVLHEEESASGQNDQDQQQTE